MENYLSIDAWNALIADAGDLVVAYTLSVVGALIILIVGFILAGAASRWVSRILARTGRVDPTLEGFLSNLVYYGLLVVFGVMVLGQFGIQTASILAALGAAGLAIGLALQGTLQNVAAGVMLLLLKPFKVGEYIDAGGVAGTIEDIGLFATRLKNFDGLFVMAPNSQLWNVPVTNYSRNETRRYELVIGIAYDDDITIAQNVLAKVVAGDERVLDTPEPEIFVSALGDSAVSVTARFWTKSADWFTTTRDLMKQGKIAFDEAGLSIPFPQRDVHIFNQEKNAAT